MPQKELDLEEELDFQPLDFQPIQTESIPVQSAGPIQSEPSLWDRLNTPLTDAPSRFASSIASNMDAPALATSPTGKGGIQDFLMKSAAQARGFGAGVTEGIGNFASEMTSPINLASTVLSAGSGGAAKMGLAKVAKALWAAGLAPSAAQGAHGASEVYGGETIADKGMGLIEIAGALSGFKKPSTKTPSSRNLKVVGDSIVNPAAAESVPTDLISKVIPEVVTQQDAAIAAAAPPSVTPDIVTPPKLPERPPVSQMGRITPLDNPTVLIKSAKATPEILKKAMDQGYEVIGTNDVGDFRLRKSNKPIVKQPLLESEVANINATSGQAQLQSDLRGAKPRFNLGSESYTPNFESDLDKALFIIAQPNPSKRDADYLKFAMKQTGMSNIEARVAGQKIREEIKGLVGGQPTGTVEIPSIFKRGIANDTPSPLTPELPTQAAIVPPIKPPDGPTVGLLHPDEPPNPVGMGEIMDQPSAHLGPLVNTRKQSNIAEAFNLSRGLMAGNDLSAPLRQGIGLIHKKQFWTSLKPMMKSWSTEEGFRASQDAIANRPMFRPRMGRNGKPQPSMAEKAGLSLTDLTNDREEALISTWAEHVPGVRRGNRAYTAFLNNLRADTFESLVRDGKTFGANGEVDLNLARSLATFVNSATGRGNLGQLESSAKALNSFFFSPRLMASRIHMLNPHNYIMAPPQVRKEMVKSLFAMTAAGNAVTQLGRMAGGEVEHDPTSSDFGKLKIGNVRVDPYAGFQQYIVAANRLVQGRVTSSVSGTESDLDNPSGPYDPTRASIAGRFLRGKLHPVLGFAYSIADAQKEMSGKQMNFTSTNPMKNAITQQFIPLIAQDTWELAKEDPKLIPLAGAAALGVGVQSYGGQDEEEEW